MEIASPIMESMAWFAPPKPEKTAAQKRLEEFDFVMENWTLPEIITYTHKLIEGMREEGL